MNSATTCRYNGADCSANLVHSPSEPFPLVPAGKKDGRVIAGALRRRTEFQERVRDRLAVGSVQCSAYLRGAITFSGTQQWWLSEQRNGIPL